MYIEIKRVPLAGNAPEPCSVFRLPSPCPHRPPTGRPTGHDPKLALSPNLSPDAGGQADKRVSERSYSSLTILMLSACRRKPLHSTNVLRYSCPC